MTDKLGMKTLSIMLFSVFILSACGKDPVKKDPMAGYSRTLQPIPVVAPLADRQCKTVPGCAEMCVNFKVLCRYENKIVNGESVQYKKCQESVQHCKDTTANLSCTGRPIADDHTADWCNLMTDTPTTYL